MSERNRHMQKITKYMKAPMTILAATLILIAGSNQLALGAFGVTSLFGMIGAAAALTVGAYVAFIAIASVVCIPLGIKQPGVLLSTAFGTVAGALAIWVFGMLVPGAILLAGLFAALPFAFVNTVMVWLIAGVTGTLRQDLSFLPTRK